MDTKTGVSRGSSGLRLFSLGRLVATPGALAVLKQNTQLATEFITRHVTVEIMGDTALSLREAGLVKF
jgi:hypothetical protein